MRRILVLLAFLLTACHRRSNAAPPGEPGASEPQYLCALENSAVRAYPIEAEGPVKPLRSFGDQVGLHTAWPLAVIDDELLVTDAYPSWHTGRTAYFGRTDQGNVAPRREAPVPIAARWNAKHREFLSFRETGYIAGLSEDGKNTLWELKTAADWPHVVAFDETRDQLLVFTPGRVRAYAYGAAGEAAPVREFALEANVWWMEVDSAHDELLALVYRGGFDFLLNAYTPSGELIRSAALGGGPFYTAAFSYSAGRDEIFMISGRNSLVVFPRVIAGAAKPGRTLSLDAEANFFILDSAHDELVVSLRHGPADDYTSRDARSSVAVYAQAAQGTATPLRVIDGGSSGAANASDLAADAAGGDVFVNGWSPASIAVFSTGKSPARRRIWSPADGLAFGGNELFTVRANTVGILSLEGVVQRSFPTAGESYSAIAYDEKRQRIWLRGDGQEFAEIYTRDGALAGTSVSRAGFFGFDPGGEVWVLASPGRIAAYRIDAGEASEPVQAIDLAHPATGRPLFLAARQEIYVPTAAGVDVYAGGALERTLEGVHASKLALCK